MMQRTQARIERRCRGRCRSGGSVVRKGERAHAKNERGQRNRRNEPHISSLVDRRTYRLALQGRVIGQHKTKDLTPTTPGRYRTPLRRPLLPAPRRGATLGRRRGK